MADLSGTNYRGVLVFAYHLSPAVGLPDGTTDLWCWRGRRYLFRAVDVEEYREHMRVRSPRWQTVTLPRDAFRALVRPLGHFTRAGQPAPEECPF